MAGPLVAILVPDPGYTVSADRVRANLEGYAAVFARAGARMAARPWTEGPRPDADVHVPLLAWGYHRREARWLEMLRTWPMARALVNAAGLLAWNTRKTYLAELERAGIAVVPTVFAELGDARALDEARARFGTDAELVLKPQTSAGGHATVRLAPGQAGALDAPAMIQPFMPAVGGEGELSVFVFGGRPAHAVAKVAAPGEFRIQPQYGGRLRSLAAPPEALALARSVLTAAPHAAAYARVDMVRDASGLLRLMEVELIEPDLYLEHMDDGGAAFAAAVLAGV